MTATWTPLSSTRAPEAGGNLAAVKAKTDNLPADPASNTQVNTRLATAGYTASDNIGIAAIKAKTDSLPASPASEANVKEPCQQCLGRL